MSADHLPTASSAAAIPRTRESTSDPRPQSVRTVTTATNSVRTSESERAGFMRPRMRHRHTSLTYLPLASVACREDEILARRWGCKPASAHQRKLRCRDDVVDVIEVKREAGAWDSLISYVEPIANALAHQSSPATDAELRAALADCDEDGAEASYRAEPSDANARLLLRQRARERQTSLDHDRVLAARHGIQL